jgi:hypothetical protein
MGAELCSLLSPAGFNASGSLFAALGSMRFPFVHCPLLIVNFSFLPLPFSFLLLHLFLFTTNFLKV